MSKNPPFLFNFTTATKYGCSWQTLSTILLGLSTGESHRAMVLTLNGTNNNNTYNAEIGAIVITTVVIISLVTKKLVIMTLVLTIPALMTLVKMTLIKMSLVITILRSYNNRRNDSESPWLDFGLGQRKVNLS